MRTEWEKIPDPFDSPGNGERAPNGVELQSGIHVDHRTPKLRRVTSPITPEAAEPSVLSQKASDIVYLILAYSWHAAAQFQFPEL
jgi:hypothetical protein